MKKILLGIWVFLLFAAPVEAYGSVLHYFTETEAGRRQAAEAAQREFRTLAQDTSSARYLQRVFSCLLSPEEKQAKLYRVLVRPEKSINAYALPGGVILVNEAALLDLPEDELKVLLAHELGHEVLQHPLAGMRRSSRSRYFLSRIRLTTTPAEGEKAAQCFIQAACSAEILCREEREADVWAAERLRASGADLTAGVRLWRHLEQLYGPASYAGNHLPFVEREKIYASNGG